MTKRKMEKYPEPRLIELNRIYDHRGNLSVVEEFREVPFEIKRVYWLYDVPGGESRGGHSHKEQSEFLVAANGSFHVNVDNGIKKYSFFLNHPYKGLFLPPGLWRTLDDFSSGAVCLVLNSGYFSEDDYIREYDDFIDDKCRL